MELELVEPFLFLAEQPQVAEHLARLLVARLDAQPLRPRRVSP
jgi:hypothetical protein